MYKPPSFWQVLQGQVIYRWGMFHGMVNSERFVSMYIYIYTQYQRHVKLQAHKHVGTLSTVLQQRQFLLVISSLGNDGAVFGLLFPLKKMYWMNIQTCMIVVFPKTYDFENNSWLVKFVFIFNIHRLGSFIQAFWLGQNSRQHD